MADLKLVEILRLGPAAWNSWRENNLAAHVDFNDLPWSDAALSTVNFAKVFLIRADLSRADLRHASLRGAILRLANGAGANFCEADFGNADLFGADLRSADLRNTQLGGAFLRRTRLHDADLRGAMGLTQTQLDEASGDENTRLPDGLRTPEAWRPERPVAAVSDDSAELALPAVSFGRSG